MPQKSVVLDATVMTTLQNCPRLADFQFSRNFRPIEGPSNSMECGLIVHKFLEYYYGNIIKGVNKTDAVGYGFAAAEMFISGCKYCTGFVPFHDHTDPKVSCGDKCRVKPECNHKPDEFPGVKNTPKEPDKSDPQEKWKTGWGWVLETCQQYIDFWRNDVWVPLEIEKVKAVQLYDDEDVRVMWKSKLDLICDTLQAIVPVDHKTMKQDRDMVSMNNQFMGQCIVTNSRNIVINKIGFQTSLKPEQKFIRKSISYSLDRLIEWQTEILPYYAKLLLMYDEMGYFPPNFQHCQSKFGNCTFLKVCENNPDMREDEIKKMFMVGSEWNPSNDE